MCFTTQIYHLATETPRHAKISHKGTETPRKKVVKYFMRRNLCVLVVKIRLVIICASVSWWLKKLRVAKKLYLLIPPLKFIILIQNLYITNQSFHLHTIRSIIKSAYMIFFINQSKILSMYKIFLASISFFGI